MDVRHYTTLEMLFSPLLTAAELDSEGGLGSSTTESQLITAICCTIPIKLISILMIGLYMLFRVYLVVECFVQISHLPDSVFTVPTWSQYIPHIS